MNKIVITFFFLITVEQVCPELGSEKLNCSRGNCRHHYRVYVRVHPWLCAPCYAWHFISLFHSIHWKNTFSAAAVSSCPCCCRTADWKSLCQHNFSLSLSLVLAVPSVHFHPHNRKQAFSRCNRKWWRTGWGKEWHSWIRTMCGSRGKTRWRAAWG